MHTSFILLISCEGAEMEVIREEYLKQLRLGKNHQELIKIVTGIRRCGKSTLMKQFISELRSAGEDSILYINFEDIGYSELSTFKDLNAYIMNNVNPDKKTYVFFDEIQRIEGWEKSVNALMISYDTDIYITGSNAYLLSSELSTYLSGRYVEIKMTPLSFKEYLKLHPADQNHSLDSRFSDYIWTGSMPMINPDEDESFNRMILDSIYNTIVVKDITPRSRIKSVSTLNSIVRFLFSNIGNITSASSIAKQIESDPRVVEDCLKALEDAYIIEKAERYDIRGKKLLKTLEKYYVEDTGMRNAILGISSREDISRQLENTAYLELKRRGYQICVGRYGDQEIDFTVMKGDVREYYQISMSIKDENTYARETRSLNSIKDSYPKTILTLDNMGFTTNEGIKVKNIIDWLLE